MAKKKGGSKAADKKPVETAESSAVEKSEKEIILTKQLEELTTESENLKETLDKLRKDNFFLQEQASSNIQDTTDYALYMKGEAERRQNHVITVNQRNQKEIETIEQECQQLNEKFDDRLAKYTEELNNKRLELEAAETELSSLDHIKVKENEALTAIAELDAALETTRTKHSTEIQQMKADFLNEKKNLSSQADSEILKLSKKATEVAQDCLNQHAERVQKENQKLRTELLALLSESDQLQTKKEQLEQQYIGFVRENEYLDDLEKMRIH